MDNPRPDKVAVVDEVRERLDGSTASVVTEYRGLTVAAMAELRRTLRAAGGDFKVFKNTLVKLAIDGGDYAALGELLEGPTAIAFVQGDVSAVAKALQDFTKANPELVIKGGVLNGSPLSASDLSALADLPSREVLLARLAGLIASPMSSMAGLLKAVPQSFAYGLKALIESLPPEEAPATTDAAPTEAVPSDEAPAVDAAKATTDLADDATDEVATDAATDAATDEVATDEVATDEATSDDVTAGDGADDVASEAAIDAASDEDAAPASNDD